MAIFLYVNMNYYSSNSIYYYTVLIILLRYRDETMGSKAAMTIPWPVKRRHTTLT